MIATALLLGAAKLLSLHEALLITEQRQPAVRVANANLSAARARANQARATLLPQLALNASYQRSTSNFIARPGALPESLSQSSGQSLATSDFFSFGATLTQQIYDFNQSIFRWQAQRRTSESVEQQARHQLVESAYETRIAFFGASAQRALLLVATRTLENEKRHLSLAQAQVDVGARPMIELLQAKTAVANARVQLIQAEANHDNAKQSLNLAMGREEPLDFELAQEQQRAVPGEELSIAALIDAALDERPDLAAIDSQLAAADATLTSLRGGYGPSLGLSTGVTEAGRQLGHLALNWNLVVSLTWTLFSGLSTHQQVAEGVSQRLRLQAERDAVVQRARTDVAQALRALRAAREAILAASDAAVAANERLALAEGRYQAGIGSAIELGDAQVALTQAEAQSVQADFNLSSARAQLLRALGQK